MTTATAWPGAAALAPPRLRAAAWAIDLLVVAVLALALTLAASWFVRDVLRVTDVWSGADRPRQVLVVAVAVAAVVFGYLGLGQAGSARTLGKRLVGLRPVQVVRMPDGGLRLIELRIGVAVLRQAAHVLDLPLGFLWRDRFHRTVADRLTACSSWWTATSAASSTSASSTATPSTSRSGGSASRPTTPCGDPDASPTSLDVGQRLSIIERCPSR